MHHYSKATSVYSSDGADNIIFIIQRDYEDNDIRFYRDNYSVSINIYK